MVYDLSQLSQLTIHPFGPGCNDFWKGDDSS